MAENSKIQWTENSWNPWHGCKKVSEGCKFCYMYRDKEKYGQDPMLVVRSKTKFNDPLKWKYPTLIFTCSWSDWFIDEADEWRDEAWGIIRATPQHTYQILTKRPERIASHLPKDWGGGYHNVWLGVSVEKNSLLSERVWPLIHTPAAIRFISAEPLLSYIDLGLDARIENSIDKLRDRINWIIVGGESGNDNGKYIYRPCELEWIESIAEQCKGNGVSVFVKQLGTHLAKQLKTKDRHGGNIDEFPEHLRIREFPAKK
jgi:protein gp37